MKDLAQAAKRLGEALKRVGDTGCPPKRVWWWQKFLRPTQIGKVYPRPGEYTCKGQFVLNVSANPELPILVLVGNALVWKRVRTCNRDAHYLGGEVSGSYIDEYTTLDLNGLGSRIYLRGATNYLIEDFKEHHPETTMAEVNDMIDNLCWVRGIIVFVDPIE